MSATQTYAVEGMTCEHCIKAVTGELVALPGVTNVSVDLRVGSLSTVSISSTEPLLRADVAAAIDEAGYVLAG